MSGVCATCGQSLPRSTDELLPERELVALSAWWLTGRYREAAMLAGVAQQTLKNQLQRSRIRAGVHSTHELALMHLAHLRSKEELLTQHKQRVTSPGRAA